MACLAALHLPSPALRISEPGFGTVTMFLGFSPQVLGPGMELYFRTLRMLGMVLVLAFFLAYCWIYVANYGIFYDKDGSPFALNRPVFFRTAGGVGTKVTGIELNGASLAAVPVQSNATIQEAMNSFIKYDIKGTATNYVKQGTFLYFIEGMSLLIGLIVYIFIQVTRLRATRIVRRVDEDTIEVSDYTVSDAAAGRGVTG